MESFGINNVKITWLRHASMMVEYEDKVIYIDPYQVPEGKKASLILITHEHFDHCDPESVKILADENTTIVAPEDCLSKIDNKYKKIGIKPFETKEIDGIKIETIPAYNFHRFREPGKPFHPKENNWVGYIIEINNTRIYHAGDTDLIPEMKQLENIDVALLPIGGTFTMDVKEASELANMIKPKYVVPIHYNTWPQIVANVREFEKLVENSEVVVLEPKFKYTE
ncbi:MAG: metal-dependent hydrolase [Candidatus Aenigmarchaeota archaeon]|nr:metal-dependent hydrolase [Candidatus Aenigmarchaeota archaeon]